MKKDSIHLLIFLISFIGLTPIFGQQSFRNLYKNANPVSRDSSYNPKKAITLHQAFLKEAIEKQDSLRQIFAYLYLSSDYIKTQAFPEAISLLIEAEKLANHAKNDLWRGYIHHWRGTVYAYTEDYDSAIEYFNLSLAINYEKRDSEIVAFNLEQLGAIAGYQEQYELAHEYYENAFPLLEKFSTSKNLAIALSNYGYLLHRDEKIPAAIAAYQKAIIVYKEVGDKQKEFRTIGNLAEEYYTLGDTEKALELYQICKAENLKNNWRLNLLNNYQGLSNVYKKLEDTDKALFYYKKFTLLNDTIKGVKVERAINKIEVVDKLQQKDLIQQKKQLSLIQTQQTLGKWKVFAVGILCLSVLLFMFFIWKRRKVNQKLQQHKEDLIQLTQALLEKK